MEETDLSLSDTFPLFATAFYYAVGKLRNAWIFSKKSKLEMYYRCMVFWGRLYLRTCPIMFNKRTLSVSFDGYTLNVDACLTGLIFPERFEKKARGV